MLPRDVVRVEAPATTATAKALRSALTAPVGAQFRDAYDGVGVVRVKVPARVGLVPGDLPREVAVASADLLDVMNVRDRAAHLASDEAVVMSSGLADRGRVTIVGPTGTEMSLHAIVVPGKTSSGFPGAVISEATARRHHLTWVSGQTLLRDRGRNTAHVVDAVLQKLTLEKYPQTGGIFRSDLGPSSRDLERLLRGGPKVITGGQRPEDAAGSLFPTFDDRGFQGDLARGPFINTDPHGLRTLVVSGAVLVLAVLAIAIALASVDRRQDDELFALLGAPPTFRRRLGAAQAGLMAAIAAIVGTILGLAAPAYGFARYNAFARGSLPPVPFVLPTDAIAVLLVGVPLVAAAGTWLLTPNSATTDHLPLFD